MIEDNGRGQFQARAIRNYRKEVLRKRLLNLSNLGIAIFLVVLGLLPLRTSGGSSGRTFRIGQWRLTIPFIGGRHGESKTGEAKAGLGTIKDRIRVYYVQNNNTLGGTDLTTYIPEAATELNGEYYASSDFSIDSITGTVVTLQAKGSAAESRPQVDFAFDCVSGKSVAGFTVTPQ